MGTTRSSQLIFAGSESNTTVVTVNDIDSTYDPNTSRLIFVERDLGTSVEVRVISTAGGVTISHLEATLPFSSTATTDVYEIRGPLDSLSFTKVGTDTLRVILRR